MPKPSKKKLMPRQLLVEGNSDKQVIEALCKRHQMSDLFSYIFPSRDGSGIEYLLKTLPDRLKQENLDTLGIVVDADLDFTARWQSLVYQLKEFGYDEIPKVLPETGLIHIQEAKPKIGVWIMPNNKLPGMLEDFVRYLIPADDKLQQKVIALLDEIETEELNPYSLTHRPKALIHSWLALQSKPGIPMGQAITAKALSEDSAIAIYLY